MGVTLAARAVLTDIQGTTSTTIPGHVYADAVAGLRRWHEAGLQLYVYSSGSVAAQQTLFGDTPAGDLRGLFSAFFDTTSGPKRASGSYATISRTIRLPPGEIVFLSDVDAELDAARAAGLQTVRLLRPADTPSDATTTHPTAASFDEIALTRS
jgi:enolase-phosphatase E1